MSIIGNFRMSTDSEIEGLLSHPELILQLLYPEKEVETNYDGKLDVDKTWHAIHFLLCGHPLQGELPLNFIMAGGSPVGDIDVGYGPSRAFTSAEVVPIAQALESITSDQLRSKFDSKAFFDNNIYPEIWDEPIEECLDSYVLSYFDDLKAFVLKAREDGKGLIVYFN